MHLTTLQGKPAPFSCSLEQPNVPCKNSPGDIPASVSTWTFFVLLSRSSCVDAFLRVPNDVVRTKARLDLLQILEQMEAPLCLAATRGRSCRRRFCPSREENSTIAVCCRQLRLSITTLRRPFYDTFFQPL